MENEWIHVRDASGRRHRALISSETASADGITGRVASIWNPRETLTCASDLAVVPAGERIEVLDSGGACHGATVTRAATTATPLAATLEMPGATVVDDYDRAFARLYATTGAKTRATQAEPVLEPFCPPKSPLLPAGTVLHVKGQSGVVHEARVLEAEPGGGVLTVELVDPRATVVRAEEVSPWAEDGKRAVKELARKMRGGSDDVEFSLTVNRAAADEFARLTRETGQSAGDVLAKALILYRESVKAQRAGKFVGVGADPGAMESVFTGLGPGLDREEDDPQVDEASPGVVTHRVTSWLAGATPGTLVERFDPDGRKWCGAVLGGGRVCVWRDVKWKTDAPEPSPEPAAAASHPRPVNGEGSGSPAAVGSAVLVSSHDGSLSVPGRVVRGDGDSLPVVRMAEPWTPTLDKDRLAEMTGKARESAFVAGPPSEPEPPRPAPAVVMPKRSAGVTMTRTDAFADSTRTTTATFWREDAGAPLDDLGEMAWRALNGDAPDEEAGGYGTAVGDDGPPFDGAHAASDVEGGRG